MTPRRMTEKVIVAVTIEPKWLAKQTPQCEGPVDERIWKTAMRLSGRSLKGMRTEGRFCVTFPIESLTDEGRKELGL